MKSVPGNVPVIYYCPENILEFENRHWIILISPVGPSVLKSNFNVNIHCLQLHSQLTDKRHLRSLNNFIGCLSHGKSLLNLVIYKETAGSFGIVLLMYFGPDTHLSVWTESLKHSQNTQRSSNFSSKPLLWKWKVGGGGRDHHQQHVPVCIGKIIVALNWMQY